MDFYFDWNAENNPKQQYGHAENQNGNISSEQILMFLFFHDLISQTERPTACVSGLVGNQPTKRKKAPRRDSGSSAARTTKSACTHC
jgi:hypothetical protein